MNGKCLAGWVVLLLASISAGPVAARPSAPADQTVRAQAQPLASPTTLLVEPIEPTQVVAIPPELLERFQRAVIAPTRLREKRLDLLVEFLFSPGGLAIEYDGARTRTIGEAFSDRKANCLTFSLLFVALARQMGIDAHVQETDHVLAWQGTGALYGNGHVNVLVKIGPTRKTVDIDRSVVGFRGAPRAISDARALAHFYNNRGAELMREGLLQPARAHLDMAIAMEPAFVGAWNNLGVWHMRKGAYKEAELAYATALGHKKRYAPTLSNMVNLYRLTGDAKRLADYEKQLFQVQQRDPFHQIILGLGYERSGNDVAAIEHLQRAIRLKAREHFVYFALARSYARLGDSRRAINALIHARDAAGERRDMYQAKLEQLRRLHGAAEIR